MYASVYYNFSKIIINQLNRAKNPDLRIEQYDPLCFHEKIGTGERPDDLSVVSGKFLNGSIDLI